MANNWTNRLALVAVAGALAACGGGAQQEAGTAAPAATETKPAEPAAAPAEPAAAPAEPAAEGGYTVSPVTGGGSVTGKVTISGAAPADEEVEITKDNQACGDKKKLQHVKAGAAGELADAVVWIDGITSGKDWPAAQGATVDQKTCAYVPAFQAVPVNTSVTIMNSDPVLHNVHAYDAAGETLFNMAQPTQGQKNERKLSKSGPVELKCDVHSWMKSVVFVAASPYYAVTGADGTFSIGDVPPGSYKAKVWHAALGTKEADVTVASGAPATVDFTLEVK